MTAIFPHRIYHRVADKLYSIRNADEIYKSAKLGSNGNGRHTQVEDEDEDMTEAGPAPPPEGEDDDGEYGPTAPPDDDEGDDEEGRFFGGGITRQEAEVLDYVEGADGGGDELADERIDATWLRRTALAFEKKISRNAELRARHADEPARFIDSEADLDAAIRALSILGEHPSLYAEFARLGCAASLVSLLAHENTDIALAAVQIVGELTGDDIGAGATDADWSALVDAMLEADLLPLLVSNLGRLDEAGDDDADREGVYRILEVAENLCSRPSAAETVARDDQLVRWLLARAAKDEGGGGGGGGVGVSQNKQYAAEMLAILAQAAPTNRTRLAELDAVEPLLQLVSPYRARDPEKGDEAEYMENLFEALTCIVDDDTGLGRQKFVEAEGHALCLVLTQSSSSGKGARKARTPALRLLDHASGRSREIGVCERVVEYGGLKTLFTLFMKIKTAGGGGGGGGDSARALEHLISIFSWMLRLLPAESAERVRTLAKFVEKDYEKTARLVALRREYAARVAAVDADIEREARAMRADQERDGAVDGWFSRRLNAGLFCLQTLDVILAWLAAEDSGAGRKIGELLADKGETLALIKASLKEQAEGVDTSTDDGKEMLDMLNTLADCLD